METYTIAYNSANPKNQTGIDSNDMTYTTRWSTVIPPRLQDRKFSLSWTFHSEMDSDGSTVAWVYTNIGGSPCVVDQSNNSSNLLGAIAPTLTWNGTEFFTQYISRASDSPPIMTSYPMQEQVTIQIKNNDGTLIDNFHEYCLTLCFTPIDE